MNEFKYKINGKEMATTVDGPLVEFDYSDIIGNSGELRRNLPLDSYKHVFVLFRAENLAGEPITGILPHGKKRHFYVQQKVSFVVVNMGD